MLLLVQLLPLLHNEFQPSHFISKNGPFARPILRHLFNPVINDLLLNALT
jgi:hypothetical protein